MTERWFIGGPCTVPTPAPSFASPVTAYEIVEAAGLTELQINGTAVDAGAIEGALLPAGAALTFTPEPGGATLLVRALGVAEPGLGRLPVSVSAPTGGLVAPTDALFGDYDGVHAYEVSFPDMFIKTATPEVRVLADNILLPSDATLTVRRADGTPVGTAALAEQARDESGVRWAVFRGTWPEAPAGAVIVRLHRSGGGTFSAGVPIVPLSRTQAFFNPALPTVQRDVGGTLSSTSNTPVIQFGTFAPRLGSLRGTTAQRPNFDLSGLPYFDTTLNKPTWRRPDGVYVDATGTPA